MITFEFLIYLSFIIFSSVVLIHSFGILLDRSKNLNLLKLFIKRQYFHSTFKEVIEDYKVDLIVKIKSLLSDQKFDNIDNINVESLFEETNKLDFKLLGVGYGKGKNKVLSSIFNAYAQWGGDFSKEKIFINFAVPTDFEFKEITDVVQHYNLDKVEYTVKINDLLSDEVITIWTKEYSFDIIEEKYFVEVKPKTIFAAEKKSSIELNPNTHQNLQNLENPIVNRNKLLTEDEIKKIKSRNTEIDIEDFDFNSEIIKVESIKTKKK